MLHGMTFQTCSTLRCLNLVSSVHYCSSVHHGQQSFQEASLSCIDVLSIGQRWNAVTACGNWKWHANNAHQSFCPFHRAAKWEQWSKMAWLLGMWKLLVTTASFLSHQTELADCGSQHVVRKVHTCLVWWHLASRHVWKQACFAGQACRAYSIMLCNKATHV